MCCHSHFICFKMRGGTLAVIYSNDKAHRCKMRLCFHIRLEHLVSRWYSDFVLIVNLFSRRAATEITFSKRKLIITIVIAQTFDKMNLTFDAVFNSAKISHFSPEARERFLAIQCRSQRFITYDNVHFNPHNKKSHWVPFRLHGVYFQGYVWVSVNARLSHPESLPHFPFSCARTF